MFPAHLPQLDENADEIQVVTIIIIIIIIS